MLLGKAMDSAGIADTAETRTAVECSSCRTRIGRPEAVNHVVEVGRSRVYVCDSCHRQIVAKDDRAGVDRAKHLLNGKASENCAVCGRKASRILGYGADLAKDLTNKEIVLISYTYIRAPRSGEAPSASVACMRKACSRCLQHIIPGLSARWMKDTEKYRWMDNYKVPL